MLHSPQLHSRQTQTIRLAELLGAFSYALDLTEGQPEGHSIRCAWIGCELGRALGLSQAQQRDLFYTLILKDLGCSSNAARICELYLADDQAFKRDFKLVGTKTADVLGFVFSRTGAQSPFLKRAKAITHILRNGPDIARSLIQTRCERGADIAKRLRFSDDVTSGIYSLDEHWDGSGKPQGLKGEQIPLFSRVALLSQIVEVFHASGGATAAIKELAARSATWLDPALVKSFRDITATADFWSTLASPDLETIVFSHSAASCEVEVDEDYLDEISEAFGQVVDAKSPYTGGHSVRVAEYADRVAELMNYDPMKRRWLRRGALLHDIGKLGVSNSILDKPGGLNTQEWEVMRSHAGHTRAILQRISPFQDLAPLAASHHERLDGKGYPLGLQESELPVEARIISVCDFYDALTADRPYRSAMQPADALAIIKEAVGPAIDRDCFEALNEMVTVTAG